MIYEQKVSYRDGQTDVFDHFDVLHNIKCSNVDQTQRSFLINLLSNFVFLDFLAIENASEPLVCAILFFNIFL